MTATAAPEALAVIRAAAAMADAPLAEITAAETARPPLDTLTLPLLGDHQRLNAALALAVSRQLQGVLPVVEAGACAALREVRWAGRLQVFHSSGNRVTLLDGAHNPAGAEVLAAALARHFPGQKPALILGILRDKDWQAICCTSPRSPSPFCWSRSRASGPPAPRNSSRRARPAIPGRG